MLYLIDSSAVLNDFSFEFKPDQKYITSPLVIDEFKDVRSRHLMENALQQGLLSIGDPSGKNLNYVEDLIAKKGFNKLSKPDISLLALALDLKAEEKEFLLITDDFSIQNFCKTLEIAFEGVMRGKISREITFSVKCSACGKSFETGFKGEKCPDCGSPIRRKQATK